MTNRTGIRPRCVWFQSPTLCFSPHHHEFPGSLLYSPANSKQHGEKFVLSVTSVPGLVLELVLINNNYCTACFRYIYDFIILSKILEGNFSPYTPLVAKISLPKYYKCIAYFSSSCLTGSDPIRQNHKISDYMQKRLFLLEIKHLTPVKQ